MMDDVMVRPRYSRSSTAGRKRRKYQKANISMTERIVLQIIICLVILVIAGLMKSINTPATNYLSDRLKAVIIYEIDLKGIYKGFSGILGKTGTGKKSGEEDTAIPASADFSDADEFGESDFSYNQSTGDEAKKKVEVAAAEVSETIKGNYDFILPVDGVLASGFGSSINAGQVSEFHTGIDIETENGSPVKSALDGEVVQVDKSPEYGKYVEIEHGDGLRTIYAHCWHILVQNGHKVKAGDVIAEVGNSGVSVGSHLHFEVLKDGKYLNPMDFLKVPVE